MEGEGEQVGEGELAVAEIVFEAVSIGLEDVEGFVASSPGESHPEALSEPDGTLSRHPAPIEQTLLW